MVLTQQLPSGLETFGDISDFILAKIMHHHATITCLVSDQYDQQSIKDLERTDLAAEGEVRYTAKRRNQSIPAQFRKYLHNSNKKLELIDFLINDWAKNINTTDILKDKELYVAVRDRAYRIFCRNGIPFEEIEQELCSSQEADTKIFLSASFIMSLGFESVCIVTNDTGILALRSYYSQRLAGKLHIEMLANPKRHFDFSKIKLDKKLYEEMPGFHAVTGSDFTCSFHGLGKTKGLNLLRQNDLFSDTFILLGEEANLNERTMEVIKRFICEFFGKQNTEELNDPRYQMFCGKRKSPDPERITPTRESFMLQLRPANFVTRIWKQAHICYPEKLNPADQCWEIGKYQKIQTRWSTLKLVLDAMLEVIYCGCKTGTCTTNRCQCHRNQLKCLNVCGSQNCSNQFEGDENSITDCSIDDESGAESDKFESETE